MRNTQLQGDFYVIGSKFQGTIDAERYTARIAKAYDEIHKEVDECDRSHGQSLLIIKSRLQFVSRKYKVKLKRLEKIFEIN